ncbi:MAG: hypothetical protein ABL895_05910 [Cyclobacteriaceae bacterium]
MNFRPYFIIAILLSAFTGAAQKKPVDTISENNRKLAFQLLCSTDSKAMYLNIVGGGIKCERRNFTVSLVVFPSLRFGNQPSGVSSKPFITPGFAVGPVFQYKRMLVGCPLYYGMDSEWHFCFGFGVKSGQ